MRMLGADLERRRFANAACSEGSSRNVFRKMRPSGYCTSSSPRRLWPGDGAVGGTLPFAEPEAAQMPFRHHLSSLCQARPSRFPTLGSPQGLEDVRVRVPQLCKCLRRCSSRGRPNRPLQAWQGALELRFGSADEHPGPRCAARVRTNT